MNTLNFAARSYVSNVPKLGRIVPNLGTLLCKLCATYLAILLYVLSINPSIACDPVSDLRSIGIKLKSLPQVIEEPNNKWPGDFTLGVIHVRDKNDCQVLLHEYVHFWQYENWGSAQDYNEWYRREMQAEQLSKRAMQ